MKARMARSSRYNPVKMDRDSLERLFVERCFNLDQIVDRLVHSVSDEAKHFVLMLGPEGSGKTHLMNLAKYRILDSLAEAGKADRALLVALDEQEWEVTSYLDLLVRILRGILANSIEIKVVVERVHQLFMFDPFQAEEFAESLIEEVVGNKTLVLICENLADLFEGIGLEGRKKLRSTIQESGSWCILASTPSMFPGVSSQSEPFYGFFTSRNLERIKYHSACELVSKWALQSSNRSLAVYLGTPEGRARMRAVHHLAGGNLRVYTTLVQYLDRELFDDLIEPFLHLVDELTPHYRGRVSRLAPAQRKIVAFLANSETAVRVKEVATGCLMSHQTAAKQIGLLVDTGLVRVTRLGRETFCELSELLLRVCLGTRNNTEEYFCRYLEFLRNWFSQQNLENRYSRLTHLSDQDIDQIHLSNALQYSNQAARGLPLVTSLEEAATECLANSDYSGLAQIQEKLVGKRGLVEDYRWLVFALCQIGEFDSAASECLDALEKHGKDAEIQFDLAKVYLLKEQPKQALSEINKAIKLDGNKTSYVRFKLDVLSKLESSTEVLETISHLDQLIDALPEDVDTLLAVADCLYSANDPTKALNLVDEASLQGTARAAAHFLRGLVLMELGLYQQAGGEFRNTLDRFPESVSSYWNLSISLLTLGEFAQAIEEIERLIQIDPGHAQSYVLLGKCLLELGQLDRATSTFNRVIELEDSDSLLLIASELLEQGHGDLAKSYMERVIEFCKDNSSALAEASRLFTVICEYEASMEAIGAFESISGDATRASCLATPNLASKAPLADAIDSFSLVDEMEAEELVRLVGSSIAVSVLNFGPRYLVSGISKAREVLKASTHEVHIGTILTELLVHSSLNFSGSIEAWEVALHELQLEFSNESDCQIPVQMLEATVMHRKSGDERHLLNLPLEQRTMLEALQNRN